MHSSFDCSPGLGLAVISNEPEPHLTVSAEKNFQLLDGPRTVLGFKLVADAKRDDKKKEIVLGSHGATIQLSHKLMNFTKRQDVKVTVGADLTWDVSTKKAKAVPLVQLRENNWALNYKGRQWSLLYDL